MLWGGTLAPFLLLLLLLPPPLPKSCPSAAPAPPAPARPAPEQSLHPCRQALLPSAGLRQGSSLTLAPPQESYLGFPLGPAPEPEHRPDPVASSGRAPKGEVAPGLDVAPKPSLSSEPAPSSGCPCALCPHLASQVKSRSGPNFIPGRPAEAALLHILSASSPRLSQRSSGVLHLSWGVQPTGSRLIFRLYQPQGCGLCQVWQVTCNPYLEAGGISCIPGKTPGRGVPSWTLARILLPGRGWGWGSCWVIGQALEGDLHLVNSSLGIRAKGSTLSLDLHQAKTGAYGPGIYYSRVAPSTSSAQRAQTHLLFYQQQGLSWLFALDFLGSRCDHLSAHLYLSPRGAAFFGSRPHKDLEVHFFTSSPLGPPGRIYLLWFIPLQHPLLPLQWTFHLQLPGSRLRQKRTYTYQDRIPSASRFIPHSVLPFHPDVYAGFVEKADCPSGSPEPAILEASLDTYGSKVLQSTVACLPNPCFISEVRIKEGGPTVLRLTGLHPYTMNAVVKVNCSVPHKVTREWSIYPIPAENATPDWSRPLNARWIKRTRHFSFFSIPERALARGLYLVHFEVKVTTAEKEMKASDFLKIRISKSDLVAVIAGDRLRRVAFNQSWTLDGSASRDPEVKDPSEGLEYRWYCTTRSSHFQFVMVPDSTRDTCLPQLPDLRWVPHSGPVHTVLPGTLRGNQAYHFRLVVQKDERKSFFDQTVRVSAGPPPAVSFSCIENCDSNLILTDRFSLSGKCTNCGEAPAYYFWSLLSFSKAQIPFDWAHRTTTGRSSPYLSVKAAAFKGFPDQRCFISLNVSNWGGAFSVSNHSFYINSPPRPGRCSIHPNKGVALRTKFVVRCRDFSDHNLPLSFKIIASNFWGVDDISSVEQNTLGAVMYSGAQSVTPPSFLPIGMPANNYLVTIYAQVYDSLGVFSQVSLYAAVTSPLDKDSPKTVLSHLLHLTQNTSGAALSTLLQQGHFVQAGYLAYLVASVVKDVEPPTNLQTDRSEIQERLIHVCKLLPINNLEEISQVTVTLAELTQEGSDLRAGAQKAATSRLMEMNLALQRYRRREKQFRSEQIEIVSSGISTSLSNIFKTGAHENTVKDIHHATELLADTILSIKVPGEAETVISTPNVKMHIKKDEKQNVTRASLAKKNGQNCLYPTLPKRNATELASDEPLSTVLYEFKADPFPWLSKEESPSADVLGFRMSENKDNGDVFDVRPEVVEAFILRKDLENAAFDLTVGPDKEDLKMTTAVFTFMVNGGYKEVFIHIITEVKVLFKVLIYVGSNITQTPPIASFLAPPDMPPVANESELFDPSCKAKVPHLICLSQSLLQATARGSVSASWRVSVVLQFPYIVLRPNDKLVRIAIFTARCLNMDGIQQAWGQKDCMVGKSSTWWRLHCICHLRAAPRNENKPPANWHLTARIRYFTGLMVVIPNSLDLRLAVIQTLPQNPVTLFTVIFIVFTYLVLAFWAMHKDITDEFLREHVIILPDNDPYDHICYLVTFYTGSRLGSGTRADVFLQLLGTEASSDVHCLSHPDFSTFYRGSTDSFLLTTRSDLGNIRAIRVWHNNEGSFPSWYLSRVKVENIFNRHIWLFICRSWLWVESLEQTFEVVDKDQPVSKKDFFLIHASELLGTKHLWLSVFSSVVTGPYSRLQRLSCCLTVLLSTLLCNIMFFNRDEEKEDMSENLKRLRGVMRGIQSAMICEPLQIAISALFTYSERKESPAPAAKVAPRIHPFMLRDFQNWKERLEMWYFHETVGPGDHTVPTKKQALGNNVTLQEAAANAITGAEEKTLESAPQPLAQQLAAPPKPAGQSALQPSAQQLAASPKPAKPSRPTTDGEAKTFTEPGDPGSSEEEEKPEKAREVKAASGKVPRRRPKKVMFFGSRPQRTVFHRWYMYVGWFLVISSSGVSSFFIIMYGLTYGYQKSVDWLIASVTAMLQSIFVGQVLKIVLLSGIKASVAKYCKNLPWATRYNFIEIRLQGMNLDADATRELHYEIVRVRGTRMYQPLVADEISIFRRRKRIKERALVFLSSGSSHFIFLVLLLAVVSLSGHPHSFHHNQVVRSHFSTNLTEVRELNDTYTWLMGVLLPLLHHRQNPTFLSNSQSQILGLPRMRQVRAKSLRKSCFLSGTAASRLMTKGIHCHSQYRPGREDRQNYGRFWTPLTESSVEARPISFTYEPHLGKWAYYSYGLAHAYGMGGYPFYFFPKQQQYNSTIRLQELWKGQWLDERTWAVILEMAIFNSDVSLFCTISAVFEASPLGVITPSLDVHSFSLPLFRRWSELELYGCGAAVVFIGLYVAGEVLAIRKEKKSYVKNVLNLVSFGLGLVILFFLLLLFIQFQMAREILDFYLENPDAFTPFHALSHMDRVLRITLGFLVFLTAVKTLRYCRFFYDVRLAQRALVAALPGVGHMAFLVAVYIFVYVASGYLVFGQHQWHYSSFIHSTQTIFSYCVSAFEDTTFLNQQLLGGLFLASFMLVMICVLINLFQAVILSAYEEMKQTVYEEPAPEVEAVTYLFHKARNLFRFLTYQPPAKEDPTSFTDILYGRPEKKSSQYLGLKTRNINGKRMTYVVV